MITKVLDWTVQRGWWPPAAGCLTACALLAIAIGNTWLWIPGSAGIVMTAVHPVGTSLRHRRLIREKQRLDREYTAATATLTVLDQLDRITGRLINMLARREDKPRP